MSLNALHKGIQLIINNKSDADFDGHKSESLILEAEKKLNLSFSPSYKEFLTKYGCGSFSGDEFYGIIHSNFEDSGLPDAIWLTLNEREESDLPHNLVLIMEGGLGDYYALDCENVNAEGEGAVVIWSPLVKVPLNKLEKVADSFGDFFLMKIEEAITNNEE